MLVKRPELFLWYELSSTRTHRLAMLLIFCCIFPHYEVCSTRMMTYCCVMQNNVFYVRYNKSMYACNGEIDSLKILVFGDFWSKFWDSKLARFA